MKRGEYAKLYFKGLLLVYLCIVGTYYSSALVITPQTTVLEEFDSSQEIVITFFNDGFEPIGFQPTTDYLSSYLSEYISIDPKKFLIEPSEQENVRITTSFPSNLPPQNHRIVLQAFPGSDDELIISFRPPGEQVIALILEDFSSVKEENGGAITITVNLKNSGNTVLFVTPRIFIKRQGNIVKNTTYPRPVVVLPGEIFPLTLRQDNSDLEPGDYLAIVDALYRADAGTRITEEKLIVFTVFESIVENVKQKDYWWTYVGIGSSFIIIILFFIWFVPRKNSRKKKDIHKISFHKVKKEKHIIKQEDMLIQAWQEFYHVRQEYSNINEEIKSFVHDAEFWLKQRRG